MDAAHRRRVLGQGDFDWNPAEDYDEDESAPGQFGKKDDDDEPSPTTR